MAHIMRIDEMSNISNTSVLLSKMEQWHKGQRRQNVKACSDEKLKAYYMICLDKGYVMETNTLYKEIVERDLQDDVPEMLFKKVDGKLDADDICKYIENHVNSIGCGCVFSFINKDLHLGGGLTHSRVLCEDYVKLLIVKLKMNNKLLK